MGYRLGTGAIIRKAAVVKSLGVEGAAPEVDAADADGAAEPATDEAADADAAAEPATDEAADAAEPEPEATAEPKADAQA